jgi:glycerophosphoryl diester phosphodiesterase
MATGYAVCGLQAVQTPKIDRMKKHTIYLFVLFTLAAGCNKTEKYLSVYSDVGVMPIQAHRGGGLKMPENTIETFMHTWALGIIPEADIRTTADDVIICVHDKTPARLAPGAPDSLLHKDFSEMTLKTVKTLDVGSFRGGVKEAVPALKEVFAVMQGHPDRFIYLDYKNINLDRLADLVKKYNLQKQVIFTSKHHNLIKEWKKRIPEAPTMIWIGGSVENIDKTFEALRKDNFEGITTLQIHYKKVKDKEGVYTPEPDYLKARLKEVSDKRILFQVLPWKISDKQVYFSLMKLGVKSFATDYPEPAVKYYKEFYK